MEHTVVVGLKGEAEEVVTLEKSAKVLKSGSLEVYGTPAFIALAEYAACRALESHIPEAYTSVGTHLHVNHTAATALGKTVRCVATVQAVEGKKITFLIEASDEKGSIGNGLHERFIVETEKFLAKLT